MGLDRENPGIISKIPLRIRIFAGVLMCVILRYGRIGVEGN